MIMMTRFGDLTPEEVAADPLIVLSCGHAFTTSTLDGHMGHARFYEGAHSMHACMLPEAHAHRWQCMQAGL